MSDHDTYTDVQTLLGAYSQKRMEGDSPLGHILRVIIASAPQFGGFPFHVTWTPDELDVEVVVALSVVILETGDGETPQTLGLIVTSLNGYVWVKSELLTVGTPDGPYPVYLNYDADVDFCNDDDGLDLFLFLERSIEERVLAQEAMKEELRALHGPETSSTDLGEAIATVALLTSTMRAEFAQDFRIGENGPIITVTGRPPEGWSGKLLPRNQVWIYISVAPQDVGRVRINGSHLEAGELSGPFPVVPNLNAEYVYLEDLTVNVIMTSSLDQRWGAADVIDA